MKRINAFECSCDFLQFITTQHYIPASERLLLLPAAHCLHLMKIESLKLSTPVCLAHFTRVSEICIRFIQFQNIISIICPYYFI